MAVAEEAEELAHTRLRRLARMARSLGRSAGLDSMVEIAAEEGLTALGGASASVSRLEQRAGVLADERDLPAARLRQAQGGGDRAAGVDGRHRRSRSRCAGGRAPPFPGQGSGLGAPLVVDGGLWGEFYATRHRGDPPFTDADIADIADVEVLTAILSGAISRALHVEVLERLAFLDPLTGLANRRALDQAAAEAFDAVAHRAGRPTGCWCPSPPCWASTSRTCPGASSPGRVATSSRCSPAVTTPPPCWLRRSASATRRASSRSGRACPAGLRAENGTAEVAPIASSWPH